MLGSVLFLSFFCNYRKYVMREKEEAKLKPEFFSIMAVLRRVEIKIFISLVGFGTLKYNNVIHYHYDAVIIKRRYL